MTSVLLDPEQGEVATADASTRQVVIAGPGAGKTQVVSALVENLILDERVDPVHGLLVLSFSNAAVHAVDGRLRARDVPPVHVRTIDSLASRIVSEFSEGEVGALAFDERIIRATQLIRGGEWCDADDLEHVVVDEVQDVVGVRADFLLALMDALPEDAGLTFLGDPAQAIYDFQIEQEGESATTSAQLLERARTVGARTIVLKGQYRATTRDARAAAGLRGEGEVVPHHHGVEDFWNQVVHVGELAAAGGLGRTRQESTAFLTATNGQALVVAGELRSLGLNVCVRRGAGQQVLASWIARVLGQVSTSSLAREELVAKVQELAPDVDPASAWRALKSVAGGKGRELDLISLCTALQSRYSIPPDLLDATNTQTVVSTVHRAKGLEFDNVVLVEFPPAGRGEQSEEVVGRERFVALTRARRLLMRADGPDVRWVRTVHCGGDSGPRWIRGGHKPWMTKAFEVRAGDLDVDAMAMYPLAQELLSNGTAVSAEVELAPCPNRSTLRVPIFEARLGGTTLAVTSESFGVEFAARTGTLEQARRGWPSLRGVRVESVATVVADSNGIGNGMLLAPVLSGLAQIEWSE